MISEEFRPTVEIMDEEVTYRLSLLNSLIDGDKVNDRVMSEVQTVFDNTPPGDQNYMVGGNRGLHPELMHLNLAALFLALKKSSPESRKKELDTALSSISSFQQLILSKDTHEIELSESVIDYVPNLNSSDVALIKNQIIVSFKRWLE